MKEPSKQHNRRDLSSGSLKATCQAINIDHAIDHCRRQRECKVLHFTR